MRINKFAFTAAKVRIFFGAPKKKHNFSIKYNADQRISEFIAIGDGEVQRHFKFLWSKGLLMKVNSYDEWGEFAGCHEEHYEDYYDIPNPHETYTLAFDPVSHWLSDWGDGSEFLTLIGKFGKGPKYLLSRIGDYPTYDVTYKIDDAGNIREEKLTHNSYMFGALEDINTYNYTSNPNYKSGK